MKEWRTLFLAVGCLLLFPLASDAQSKKEAEKEEQEEKGGQENSPRVDKSVSGASKVDKVEAGKLPGIRSKDKKVEPIKIERKRALSGEKNNEASDDLRRPPKKKGRQVSGEEDLSSDEEKEGKEPKE